MILPTPHRNFAAALVTGYDAKLRWGLGKIIFPRIFLQGSSAEP